MERLSERAILAKLKNRPEAKRLSKHPARTTTAELIRPLVAARNKARLSTTRLVGPDEMVEIQAGELLSLSPEHMENCRETIRIYRLAEQAIDKRRLLSDPVQGGGDPTHPPGDTFVVDLLMEVGRRHESLNRKRRRILAELYEEVTELNRWFFTQLDKSEGWMDPDRVQDRVEKRARKEAAVAGGGQG